MKLLLVYTVLAFDHGAAFSVPIVVRRTVSHRGSRMTARAAAATAVAPDSVTLFPWFGSTEREQRGATLAWKRLGAKSVYVDDKLSMLSACSPLGWYRYTRKRANDPEWRPTFVDADREDYVHAVSGGIFALYLSLLNVDTVGAGTLVLDSTPILPAPRNLANFALLAFAGPMSEKAPPIVFRAARLVLRGFYTVMFRTIALGMIAYHSLIRSPLTRWEKWGLVVIARGDWPRLGLHVMRTVVRRPNWRRVVIVNNPDDPFLDSGDKKALQNELHFLREGEPARAHHTEVEIFDVGTKHATHMFNRKQMARVIAGPEEREAATAEAERHL